jgi:hypothetical protein
MQDSRQFKQKYKYAADYGFILGGYIAFFFILDFLLPGNIVVNILNNMGFFGTPVLGYYLAKRYRDRAFGGFIRFGQVWAFGVWLFIFASLLMSVLYYIRFEFLQPTLIADTLNQVKQQLMQIPNSQQQLDALIAFGTPTTIEFIMLYIWSYILGAAFLYLIIAPFVVRKPIPPLPTDSGYKPYEGSDNNEKPNQELKK